MATNDGKGTLISDNLKWIVTALVIPLSTWIYSSYEDGQKARENDSKERIAREDRDAREAVAQRAALVQALLPDLISTDEGRRNLTLVVVKELDASDQIPANLKAVAGAFVKASERRTRSGQGTLRDAEVAEISAPAKVLAGWAGVAAAAPDAAKPPAAAGSAPLPPPPPVSPAPLPPVAATVAVAPPGDAAKPTASARAALPSAPLVYIQIYSDEQRKAALALQADLRQQGIGAPGIENVVRTAAARKLAVPFVDGRKGCTVVYFHAEDAALAANVARLAEARGQADVKVLQRAALAGKVPSGQIEVWWPPEPGNEAKQP